MATRANPAELVVFGNPRKSKRKKKNAASFGNHKPGCECAFCVRAAKLQSGELKPPPLPNRGKKKNPKPKNASAVRGRRAGASASRRQRRNPDELKQAVKLFRSFHGKEAREILEPILSAAQRRDYTALGTCLAIGLEDGGLPPSKLAINWDKLNSIYFSEKEGVKLASSPNGKQLYILGGNQDMSSSLHKWEGVDPTKDLIDLGDAYFVTYVASKIHDDYKPTIYTHAFGEESGVLPRLMYDQLKKQLFFVGGEYFIDMKEISPGIEN
jgi:hypothetical protein